MTRPAEHDGLSRRIAHLSPERRELLRKLMAGVRAEAEPSPPAAHATREPLPITREAVSVDQGKELGRSLYELVNRNLDRTAFAAQAVFLNLGYVADGNPHRSPVELPRHCLNRNALRLALEVLADVPLDGRAVVDVGCGRGGTIAAMRTYFSPGIVVGVDFSRSAIAFSRRTHRFERTWFVEGNAQELPLADASFSVVTNIESASGYADVGRFYREVFRVLRPGGRFLYADVVPREGMAERRGVLSAIGFAVESERDITSNVLLSCAETANVHKLVIGAGHEDDVVGNFLAVPGSAVYESMKSGDLAYLIYEARRT